MGGWSAGYIGGDPQVRDCEVFPVFRVGEGLDVGRDEDHEYVPKVLRCGGDDALDGFAISLVG